jgi:hypothetical protein
MDESLADQPKLELLRYGLYFQELWRQTEVVSKAWDRLQTLKSRALRNRPQAVRSQAWSNVASMLAAHAIMSKFAYPPTNSPRAHEQARYLRGEIPLLQQEIFSKTSRETRNGFEHFDERLDDICFSEGVIAGEALGHNHVWFLEVGQTIRPPIRWLTLGDWTVSVAGNEMQLDELAKAVQDVQDFLRADPKRFSIPWFYLRPSDEPPLGMRSDMFLIEVPPAVRMVRSDSLRQTDKSPSPGQ